MTFPMWILFIIGLFTVGATPWGFLPIAISVGFLISGGE